MGVLKINTWKRRKKNNLYLGRDGLGGGAGGAYLTWLDNR
jgi:hypothetical protein